jgi:polar amino acid transport system substrate-binding protein
MGLIWGLVGVVALGALLPREGQAQPAPAAPASSPTALRMGYTSTWSMPWGEVQAGQVRAGIHKDVAEAVAQRLGNTVEFVLLPQRRPGEPDRPPAFDLGCGMDPSWFAESQQFHWSEPLFDTSDQLLGHAGRTGDKAQPPPATLAALRKGSRVGTVRSYHYPTLEARLSKGELRREDALDQASVLAKLVRQRSDVAVASPQSIAWFLRQQPQAATALAPWRLKVQDSAYHCAVPRSSPVDAQRVLEAVHALKREGELARILARYAP